MKPTKLNLVEDFVEDLLYVSLGEFDLIDGYEDYSDYVFIDGEEGDYGKIKYYDLDKNLLATKIDYGGDDFDWKWDDRFKEYVFEEIVKKLKKKIDEL